MAAAAAERDAEQLPLPAVAGGADPKGVDDSDRARGARGAGGPGGRLYSAKPPQSAPRRINVDEFVDHGGDFIDIMARQARELPQIAYGLLKLATTTGEPNAIAAASKNWHEASGHAADVLDRYMAAQKAAGALLSLADVADVVVTELEEIRKRLKRLGQRHAAKANPADPALAQRIFDAAVDAALGDPAAIVERVNLETVARADEIPPELAPGPAAAAAPAA